MAEKEGIDIKTYNVIYEAIDEIRSALEGLLAPTITERILGKAEVRNLFQVSRIGTIAGSYVLEGIISRSSSGVRVIRDNVVVYDGKLSSLKRFKDDVKEVQSGFECGIMVEKFNDIKVGDVFEVYIKEEVAGKFA
jgi:translation initiation factor IF-2